MNIRHYLFLLTAATAVTAAHANTQLVHPTVQRAVTPLAVEDHHPYFGWQMQSDEQGQYQSAYRIVVTRESDQRVVWDTGRRDSRQSIDIEYQGVALQPEKGYRWDLTVWDSNNHPLILHDRFETGLMSSRQSAWGDASWIGVKHSQLDAQSESMFTIETDFQIKKGKKMSMVLGANDLRLNDAMYNGYGLEGENYLRFELDFGTSASTQGTTLRIYRVGYAPGDRADMPLIVINRETYPQSNLSELLPAGSERQKHHLELTVEVGTIRFYIDGHDLMCEPAPPPSPYSGFSVNAYQEHGQATHIVVNPWGSGGDYPSFPNLCQVGFAAESGSLVEYTDYRILYEGMTAEREAFGSVDYSIWQSASPLVRIKGNTLLVAGTKTGGMMLAYSDPSHGGNTMLRTTFCPKRKVRSAKLYATAMGVYTLWLNGERVGEDYFAPGDCQYRETMGYQAYDVTSQIREGNNALGALLSGGWYTGYMTYTTSNRSFFGDYEALMARLVLTYDDGSRDVIVTCPDTWQASQQGPVRYGSFLQGERYDARREADVAGWTTADYDASQWIEPTEITPRSWIDFDLMARYDEPVRLRETLQSTCVMPIGSADGHTYIYNMGVNMVGVPQISIPAGWLQPGDTVRLAYAEQLYPGLEGDKQEYIDRFGPQSGRPVAGHMQFETNRAALDIDLYVAAGSEAVTYIPQTTYRGYQYIQITLPSHVGPLPLECVKGLVLSSCEKPSCSYQATTADGRTGQLVNQLFANIQRSQLGNFFTIPTDCPQRNERMGWTGDAQAYTRTATYNANVQNFFRQWMVALRADQGIGSDTEAPGGIGSTVPTYVMADDTTFATGTTWAGAVCMVPWQLYQQYGDTQIISENIEAMMDWLNGMAFYPMSSDYPHLSDRAQGLADWLAQDVRTSSEICNNAIYIYLMDATAKMARAIGREDYAQTLESRYKLAKEEWNRAYVNSVTGKTQHPTGRTMHTQASYATPLAFGVFNDQNRQRAEAWLAELTREPVLSGPTPEEEAAEKDLPVFFNPLGMISGQVDYKSFKPYTITTGFSGTPNILPALSNGGYHDEAYRLISSTAFPSWLYPVTEGATSMWERWNSYDSAFSEVTQNSMNSFNHFALGAVGQWMFEYQLGITSGSHAGYQHFVLQPTVGGDYTSLSGSYVSNYGTIKVAWEADGQGHLTRYETTIPANTTATLYLPIDEPSANTVMHLGRPCVKMELGSGTFTWSK